MLEEFFFFYWLKIGKEHQVWNTVMGDLNKNQLIFSKILV